MCFCSHLYSRKPAPAVTLMVPVPVVQHECGSAPPARNPTSSPHAAPAGVTCSCAASEKFNMPCQPIEEACEHRSGLVSFFLRAHHKVGNTARGLYSLLIVPSSLNYFLQTCVSSPHHSPVSNFPPSAIARLTPTRSPARSFGRRSRSVPVPQAYAEDCDGPYRVLAD